MAQALACGVLLLGPRALAQPNPHRLKPAPRDSTINSDLRLHFGAWGLAQWGSSSAGFSLCGFEFRSEQKAHRLKPVLLKTMNTRTEIAAILIVEDEAKMRRLLELQLGEEGFLVHTAADAETGLQLLVREKPDIVVTDLRLPGMSGIELHRRLLASKYKVPVVFITAHASDDQARSEASSDWTVAYLTKPFNDDELLDAVHAASRLKSNHSHN